MWGVHRSSVNRVQSASGQRITATIPSSFSSSPFLPSFLLLLLLLLPFPSGGEGERCVLEKGGEEDDDDRGGGIGKVRGR